jgi:vacuolar protein sorting-associated protein 13D
MDQFLCMRLLDITGSQCSGGFLNENVNSFQLSTRDHHGRARFLRVEISLFFSTFCVVISSADNFPPPFRVDNFSEVPITFYQTGVSDQLLRAVFEPNQSVPYALDGPVLPPHLTVSAPVCSVATYNMNVTGAGSELTYENFIYIAMTGTFQYGCGILNLGMGCSWCWMFQRQQSCSLQGVWG